MSILTFVIDTLHHAFPRLPQLYRHFNSMGVSVSMFAVPWLLCLFSQGVCTAAQTEEVRTRRLQQLYACWDRVIALGDQAVFDTALRILHRYALRARTRLALLYRAAARC